LLAAATSTWGSISLCGSAKPPRTTRRNTARPGYPRTFT
jgi:hypothetical protein